MANRFVRRIREGEIDSIEDLKSEFKSLAKESHPDLAGPAAMDAFIQVRSEYEAALGDFGRHRWGFRNPVRRAGPQTGDSAAPDLFMALGMLLRRGFPREPRHEKQRLRYDYAKFRLEELLAAAGGDEDRLFRDFETAILETKAKDPAAAERYVGLLAELVDYARRRLPAMRTSLILALGALSSDPRHGRALGKFPAALAARLGIGPAIG